MFWKMPTLMLICAGSIGSAQAQNYVYWPAPQSANTAASRYYLPMGTPLLLTTRTQISTLENRPGDRIYLNVAESVAFRGQVVIPIGAPVVAEVTRVQRNGHFGRKGKLEIQLLYAETPAGPVRLTGRSYDEGKSGTLASIATMAFVSGLGFLIHGTSGRIEPGTPVQAYLAEPMAFTMAAQPQQTAAAPVQAEPDPARPLPARFDPSVFGRPPIGR